MPVLAGAIATAFSFRRDRDSGMAGVGGTPASAQFTAVERKGNSGGQPCAEQRCNWWLGVALVSLPVMNR
jgi:hypothetical protein